jgi:hypothetical protein
MATADVVGGVVEALAWIIVGYVVYLTVRRLHPNSVSSIISFRPGREYGFLFGDDLYAYRTYGNFNGLDLRLPIEMPHIYLDSLRSGGRDVAAVFDASQRISLEGDFDTYFNVFVPRQYEAVALSILTPDVMETLQKYASDYDVEIYGDHLRVISNHKVLKSADAQASMLEVADKIIKEIEDRQASWTELNTMQSIDQDLLVYPSRGFRLFNRYMTWSRFWLSVYWFLCIGGILGFGVLLIFEKQYGFGIFIIAGSVMVYLILQKFTAVTQAVSRFRSRHH